jgi:hypothetical protein
MAYTDKAVGAIFLGIAAIVFTYYTIWVLVLVSSL